MRFFRLFFLSVRVVSLIFASVYPAYSEEADLSSKKTADEKVDDLDQKLRTLERRFELQQERAAEKAKETSGSGSGKDPFLIKSADDHFQLRIRGVIQADGRFLDPGTDTFVLSRVRPIFEGTLYHYFDFKFIPDFGAGKTVIQDAYFVVRFYPALNVQIGKSKAPFGLERLQADTDLRFVERALPTNLVPNRDIGVEFHRDAPSGLFTYALGVFNGVPDGGSADADRNDNKEIVGRIFLHPFKEVSFKPIQGFGIGFAASDGIAQGSLGAADLPSYTTVGQQVFFQYRSGTTVAATALADGTRFRTSPQVYYYLGAFGLIGEYVASSQEVRKDLETARLKNRAWQAAASYFITGEKNSYGSVFPSRPFDPGSGRWGAFEVAARYNRLTIDPDAFPVFADPTKSVQEASGWAGGINWYLNKAVKFMLDYEQTHFTGGSVGEDRETERAILTRSQIAF